MIRARCHPPIAFLALASLAALVWVVPHAFRLTGQHRAHAWVSAAGGYISYAADQSDGSNTFGRWLRKSLGRHLVDPIDHITVRSPGYTVTPGQIRALRHIPTLSQLAINTTNLSHDHIAALGTLTQVRELYLDESTVTDDHLATISTFHHLDFLGLCETPVTDHGLAHLAGMRNLTGLDLSDTALSAEGLAHISNITGLQELYIARTRVGDHALHHLRSLTKLQLLHLGEHVSDAGMPHVAALPALRNLSLENSTVSNDGIALVMDTHPEFDHLHLFHTYVTADKMADIEKSHPGILLQAAY